METGDRIYYNIRDRKENMEILRGIERTLCFLTKSEKYRVGCWIKSLGKEELMKGRSFKMSDRWVVSFPVTPYGEESRQEFEEIMEGYVQAETH